MRAIPFTAALLLLTACGTVQELKRGSLKDSPAEAQRKIEESDTKTLAAASVAAGGANSAPEQSGPLDFTGKQFIRGPDYSALMIIRVGTASLEVKALDAALADLQSLAVQSGGYVANTQFTGGKDQYRVASIEIRMPADRFDQAVSGLRGIGTLETLQVSAEDVGEEYADIAARVANARRMEQRLIELLATRTGKLADVLTVEGELARVREQIERYEGRMRYLKDRTATSRITVSVHEPLPIGRRPAGPITLAFARAWQNFIELVALAISTAGVVIPVAGIIAGAWWTWRKRRRPLPQLA
jgi:hypothetical protein